VSQYYILQKEVHHASLESEGGIGLTYIIEKGSFVYSKRNWRYERIFAEMVKCLNGSTLLLPTD